MTIIYIRFLYDVWMERRGKRYASGERRLAKSSMDLDSKLYAYRAYSRPGGKARRRRKCLLQLAGRSRDLLASVPPQRMMHKKDGRIAVLAAS
ncbi:unnamed protein product [Ascophyllum nodosum]